jgi:hypothetical protein
LAGPQRQFHLWRKPILFFGGHSRRNGVNPLGNGGNAFGCISNSIHLGSTAPGGGRDSCCGEGNTSQCKGNTRDDKTLSFCLKTKSFAPLTSQPAVGWRAGREPKLRGFSSASLAYCEIFHNIASGWHNLGLCVYLLGRSGLVVLPVVF